MHLWHTYGEWHVEEHPCILIRRCKNPSCGTKQEKWDHKYSDWMYQRDGSCQQVKVCAQCGDTVQRKEIFHQFGELEYIQSDSCLRFTKCERCGIRERREEKHVYGDWEYHSEDSCEKRKVCSHCGQMMTKIEHTPVNVVVAGSECRTDVECSRCGILMRSDFDHSWSAAEVPLSKSLKNAIEYEDQMTVELEKLIAKHETDPLDQRYARLSAARLNAIQRSRQYKDQLLRVSADAVSTYCTKCRMPLFLGKQADRAKKLKGFLSYNHVDSAYADRIDRALRKNGYVITRDIRDMDIGENLYEFMDRVKESQYVVALLSDEYLRSKYCMYEATKIISALLNEGCRLFVICIGVDPADGATYDKYLQYWQETREQAMVNGGKKEDIAIYGDIVAGLQTFLSAVNSVKYAAIQNMDQLDAVLLKQILSMVEKIE